MAITRVATIAGQTRRRINRRLLPFLFLLYIIAFLDRINVSFAGLDMTRELGFSDRVFGLGSGIFFAGYVLLEIPGTLLVELWSARKWIARIMISWGLVGSLTGLIHTADQFYWARFILGVAEAGFFPGVVVYLTHWYREQDRARAMAMFMSAIPIAQVIGAPISGALLNIHWLGYSGWRWLLFLEGVPAVIAGFVALFYLTDRPRDARWLSDDERAWITGELEARSQDQAKPANVSLAGLLARVPRPRRDSVDLGLLLRGLRAVRFQLLAAQDDSEAVGVWLLRGGDDRRPAFPGFLAGDAAVELEFGSHRRAALAHRSGLYRPGRRVGWELMGGRQGGAGHSDVLAGGHRHQCPFAGLLDLTGLPAGWGNGGGVRRRHQLHRQSGGICRPLSAGGAEHGHGQLFNWNLVSYRRIRPGSGVDPAGTNQARVPAD